MKKYYTYNNYQQEGPFTIEELKEKQINRDTMIWFEGQSEWIQAFNIEELKELFKSITPPPTIPNPSLQNSSKMNEKVLTFSKDIPSPSKRNKYTGIYITIGLILLIMVVGAFYYNQYSNQQNLEIQLEDQNQKIQEQERIEQNRLNAERKRKREEELQVLNFQLDDAITNLRFANEKLEEIKQFQLFRAKYEREAQIQSQLEVIRTWENEVERIKGEINKY